MNHSEQLVLMADRIAAQAESLPRELVTWKPAPDAWSMIEILCHVEEFIPFWTQQAVNIARGAGDSWGRDHTDTRRLAAVQGANERELAEVTANIRSEARAAAGTLSRLSEADLAMEATSRNPRWGVKPARFIVEHLLVQHVEKHIGQIQRNAAQHPGKPA
ncbi:MAG: DinB family protein [Bryobacteraceae bacterium]